MAARLQRRNAVDVGVQLSRAGAPKARERNHANMLRLKVSSFAPPQLLILICLLLLWNPRINLSEDIQNLCIASCAQDFRFVEHYAGSHHMTEQMRADHGTCACMDILYHKGFDILTPAGFAFEPYCIACVHACMHYIFKL